MDAAPPDFDLAQEVPAAFHAASGSHSVLDDYHLGRRFHWRRYDQWINGVLQEQYEVYSSNLETWAICYLPNEAESVAKGLELTVSDNKTNRTICENSCCTVRILCEYKAVTQTAHHENNHHQLYQSNQP
jgi:hypothetical protein